MSVHRRGYTVDEKGNEVGGDDYYYRFSYKGRSYCEGGFVKMGQAVEAERLQKNALIEGRMNPGGLAGKEKRLSIGEACAIFLEKHGPSLKGGISKRSKSSYYGLKTVLRGLEKAWAGRAMDTITDLDVRDYLSAFKTVGTKMRYLGIVSKLFKSFKEWNDDRNILRERVALPAYNPAHRWRGKMKSTQKKELPLTRVLSVAEWSAFKVHLSARTRAVCEIALRRLLRMADIRQISFRMIKNQMIDGLQAKTGGQLMVPVLADQPTSYDFTNFKREFKAAQLAAGLDFPNGHPLHFTVRDLRRTGATWAYHKTKDLRSIQKMLGHAKLSTTERYLNVSDENLRGIADAIDSMVVDTVLVQIPALQPDCNRKSETENIGNKNVSRI